MLISAIIILAITLTFALTVNAALGAYGEESSALLRIEAEYGEKEKAVRAEISEFLSGEESSASKYYADLALADALTKQEAYYEHYTENGHRNTAEQRDFHYYGQYYELFNNVYNANVIFLGSSRSVYGINPLYLEKNEDLSEYSFYNFSLNAAGPSFYQQWYDIFKNEAEYPTPDTVIYCVDWFMFDTGDWMWRTMNTDSQYKGALYEIRQYMNSSSKVKLLSNTYSAETDEAVTDAPVTDSVADTSETPDDNTAEREYENIWELIAAWWNGEEKLDLSSVAEWLTEEIPLFADQKNIPDMISYYAGGENKDAARKLKEKTAELEAKLAELEAERDELFAGGKDEYPEVVIPDYYSKRDLCIDQDGNISSKFYKGFIPWEYKYFHNSEGTNPAYNDEEVDKGIRQVEGISRKEVNAFKSLIKEMQDDGINVILIQIPDYAKHRPDDEIAKYTETIIELADELGVEFYDYNNDLSVTGSLVGDYKRYYSNWNHMNEIGAKKFSTELAKELVDILK